jgi:hypothetical protein
MAIAYARTGYQGGAAEWWLHVHKWHDFLPDHGDDVVP